MSSKRLLLVDRRKVREKLGKSDKDVRDYTNIIKDWFEQQPHLTETPSDHLIEYFLIMNKFSVERAKSKLDMYYTIRALMPEIFKNIPSHDNMRNIGKIVIHCPLPKLTDELYRVNVTKILGDPSLFNPYHLFAHQVNVNEIRLHEDLNMGDLLIVDLAELKMGHILKLTPVVLRKALVILEEVYSNRLKAFHLINCPIFVDKLIAVLKSVMKQKIIDRIYVHSNIGDLTNYIPKMVLPKNYGGEEMYIEELMDQWMLKLEDYKERFEKLDSIKVDESLRSIPLENHELLGYYGNFRKLDID